MKQWLKKHFTKKRLIGACSVVLVAGSVVGYHLSQTPSGEVRYVTAPATKGLLISSITGTGQVSGENQVDIKPKVSGDVDALLVKEGQQVKKDDVLMDLSRKDALKTIRDVAQSVHDAQISLASTKLSLEKLKQPPSAASLLQSGNSVNQAKRDLDKLMQGPDQFDLQQAQIQLASAEQNAKLSSDGKTPQVVRNAYDTTVENLVSDMQALSDSLLDADSILAIDNTNANISFANLLSVLDQGLKNKAVADYAQARDAIQTAKVLTDGLAFQNEDPDKIDAALNAVQDATVKSLVLMTDTSSALQATLTSSSFSQSSLDSLKSKIQGSRGSITSKQAAVLSQIQSIAQAKTTFANSGVSLQQAHISLDRLMQPADARDIDAAKERIAEAEQQLAELKAGPSAIDLAVTQNSIDQRVSSLTAAQNKLADAQETLNDYSVRAPFDGVVATLSVHKADSVSAGASVVTLIAKEQMAQITLNEVDAAKVKVGQKVTLTFDAVDSLSIAGTVDEVATLGTVSQGVVSYAVKIGFDTQDDRVRPGMSVRAAIVIEAKPDVVLVPNAAVKSSGGSSYVQILDASASTSTPATGAGQGVTGTPRMQVVTVGSSNDTSTEIVSGLNEGDPVVIQTIQPASKTTTAAKTTTGTSLIPGLGGGATRGAGGGGATFTARPGG